MHKINIFYFVHGLYHLLNCNLNQKNIHFPYMSKFPIFIKFLKFPVFLLPGKIDNQIPYFSCAVATLFHLIQAKRWHFSSVKPNPTYLVRPVDVWYEWMLPLLRPIVVLYVCAPVARIPAPHRTCRYETCLSAELLRQILLVTDCKLKITY